MATQIEKIKERKAALLERLSVLEKKSALAESNEKKGRRKEDSRTKILLGVLVAASLKEKRSVDLITELARQADKLTAYQRKFLKGSALWNELKIPTPIQDAEKEITPAPASQVKAQVTQPPAVPPGPKPPVVKDDAGFLQSIKRTLGG